MKNKRLQIKKSKELPYNYSLYPVEEFSDEKLVQTAETKPVEYCKVYRAKLFVEMPFKKIIEY